jgi:hypothetical protein
MRSKRSAAWSNGVLTYEQSKRSKLSVVSV